MNTLIALSVLAVITLFLGIFNLKKWLLPTIIIGLLVAAGLNFADWGHTKYYYSNMFFTDSFSVSFGMVMIVSTLLVFFISAQYYKKDTNNLEGIFAIVLFTLIGGIVMISSSNLITFFVGIEILSISLYLLAGSHRTSHASNEAAMKYFLMGSFASAFLLFGITLIYGATGSFDSQAITIYMNSQVGPIPLLLKAGILLMVIGMSFKVAAAPFHFWAPDVYHGSPTLITAFMITTVKVAGIAAFVRLTFNYFGKDYSLWSQSLAVISGLSILIGNFGALAQNRTKRMLAYSSVAHSGYVLLALVSLQATTASYVIYYLVAYVLSNLAAFLVLISLKQTVGNTGFDSFNGLAKNNPVIAFCMAIAMLSLTGIPPLAGFMGKYLVFTSALQQGYVWLVVVAVIGSVVSIFYYFRPVINMYMKAPEQQVPLVMTKLSMAVLILLTALSLIFGFAPGLLL
jgi:NADH-quinone oxidoreductase subunit N